MSERYERVYEVGLLDDLHNYFPALLYRPNNFQSVTDVLGYIRDRTTQRFNLFEYGRRQYENSVPISSLFPNGFGAPNGYGQQPGYGQPNRYGPQNDFVPQSPEVSVEFTSATNAAALLPLLRSLGGLRNRRRTYEDVVVHASQSIIDEASTEQTLSQDLDTLCTICQDRMRQGELTRKLTVCCHEFHKSCIDNWLLHRSVICPTCRHDIREPVRRSSPSPRLTATTAPTHIAATHIEPEPSTTTANTVDDMLPGELMTLLFGRSYTN